MKYSKYLNLSESINATKDTIVLIAKPTNTTLKELSTCCIIVLSFSSSTICSTTFEKGGNIYDDTSPVLETNSHNNIMQIIQNRAFVVRIILQKLTGF